MALKNILDNVARDLGYDVETQRVLMLSYINSAAKEVYESQDLPGCYREITVEVVPELTASLPYYVGELRAMRERSTRAKIELKEMAPRYSYNSWPELWRSWRLVKKSPIQRAIKHAASPITFTIAEVEIVPLNITITGATLNSARVSEVVTILVGEKSVNALNNFTEVHSITKEATNIQNITVTGFDSDGVTVITLAVIPNDRLFSVYTIVDVSQLPVSGDVQGRNARYVDVLYKEPLFVMFNDGDEFPCEGFDDAIVAKTCELVYSGKDGGGDKAIGFYQKTNEIIFNRINSTNGTTQKEITLAPNQYLDLHPPYPALYRTTVFGVSR
jgi:hypothetical protein